MPRALALVLTLAAALAAAPARAADPAVEAATAYRIDTAGTTADVKAGEPGKLVVAIVPTATGWHVHPQAPLHIRFQAPDAVKVAKPDLGRTDVVDAKAAAPRFETSFVAAAAGSHEVSAKVDFFICTDAACVKQGRTVAIPITAR